MALPFFPFMFYEDCPSHCSQYCPSHRTLYGARHRTLYRPRHSYLGLCHSHLDYFFTLSSLTYICVIS